ncbi:MAG: hypothetical protein GY803_25670 [Chloroflexi bacterium]|nr:hypothetical protein [Chloroflexota bacterium]
MIKIDSAVRFSFMFPADRAAAFAYYSDMRRLTQHLKYIDLVDSEPDDEENEFRLYYNTTELGSYHIHVYCDVRMDTNCDQHAICLEPIESLPAVKTKVTISSTTARGFYSSEAKFFTAGEQTRVEYMLSMKARPPRPKGMRFMPGRMVDRIAQNITNHRVKEIAEAFIASSIDAFPEWLAASG